MISLFNYASGIVILGDIKILYQELSVINAPIPVTNCCIPITRVVGEVHNWFI
ncbi:hypothetical protein LINPERHAP1_LOCUS36725 [Linum perenne]